ncbi:MAG: putative MATE family efflux protein [Candidatus Azotimanducaceae bacterium]|jgi:putative MATE family efflux protein|tara:strand:- start:5548 stop:6858 length:1311 start_codon:yes stop_codon:yes gene_type:complete
MTLPMILGISSSLLAGLAEAYYLGLLGSEQLAALGFTFPVTAALMSITLGVSIGLSSVLAREVGGGHKELIQRTTTGGLILAAGIMILVTLLGLATLDVLFIGLGADDNTLPLVTSYMQLWYCSLVFMAVPSVGANALRATGDARISGTLMVSGSVLQILFAPIFIFGWLGMPELGMTGAALGNLLARFIICILTFYILTVPYRLINFSELTLTYLLQAWRRILVVSIPATATNLIGPISSGLIISLLANYSQEAVAGFAIASRIEALFVIPLFALSASIGPYVGQNWGAGATERADKAMRLSFQWSLLWGLVVALVLAFAGPGLIALFDSNAEVTKTAEHYLMILPISYGAWGIIMMTSAIFNALGYPLRSTLMSFIRMLGIYVPLALTFDHFFGMTGIFVAALVANVLVAALGYVWNRKTFRRHAAGAASEAPN